MLGEQAVIAELCLPFAIREVVEEAYAADPGNDRVCGLMIFSQSYPRPAVDKYSARLLYLKGFHALRAYRIGHWILESLGPSRAGYFHRKMQVSVTFRVGIHPGSVNWCRYHARIRGQVVVGETAVIRKRRYRFCNL